LLRRSRPGAGAAAGRDGVEWSPGAGVVVVEHDRRVSQEAVRREAGRSGIALMPAG
jgi:hypothetical protein